MNTKSFVVLTLATVLIAALAYFSINSTANSNTETETGNRLFPELIESINDVAVFTIENAEGKLTMKRIGETWGLEEKHDYPVDLAKISTNLKAMALMETIEAKTKEPKRYAALGVEGLGEDSESTLLTLKGENDKLLASLIVGQKRGGRAGSDELYVREKGQEQSWLVRGKLTIDSDSANWIDKKIAKIERSRIQAMSIEHSDGETVRISKPDKDTQSFTVHDVPDGRELSYASVADGMANTLEWLNLEDVVPTSEIELGDDWDTKTTFWTFDGLELEATLTKKDGETWARFSARLDADGADFVESGEGEEEAEPVDTSAVEAEIARLEARLEQWVYKLPTHSMTALGKRMEQLLKPLPIEVEETEGDEEESEEEWSSDSMRIEDLLTPEQLEQLNTEHGTEFPVEPDKPEDASDDDGGR